MDSPQFILLDKKRYIGLARIIVGTRSSETKTIFSERHSFFRFATASFIKRSKRVAMKEFSILTDIISLGTKLVVLTSR